MVISLRTDIVLIPTQHQILSMATKERSLLEERLAAVLPENCCFMIHHLSTPPTLSHPLYAAPPGQLAEETYCESHFLSVSIDSDGQPLQVFGIEVLVYSTEYLTTLFVSKADSTGYLYLLNLQPGTPSPLKTISSTFLKHLIIERQRLNKRLVLSLFARAQNQYLFPGSIENSHKHVLDDRGLIRWWCKVVDPMLSSFEGSDGNETAANEVGENTPKQPKIKSRGYLRVPGCDLYETRGFLPKNRSGQAIGQHPWHTSDPLTELGRPSSLPERCLIPRFPDDPKARFVEQLDDELPDEDSQQSQSQSHLQRPGRWRSVRSLEQFWDLMSFRQECSSGRLVGFLWATFQPASLLQPDATVEAKGPLQNAPETALPTPDVSQHQLSLDLPPQSPIRSSPPPELPSTPSKQRPEPSPSTPLPTPLKLKEAALRSQPEETPYYYWPKSSRGEIVLRQKDYQRAWKVLQRLDYADKSIALDSSRKWIKDVVDRGGVTTWGRLVNGTVPVLTERAVATADAAPAVLGAGLIRKKKRPIEDLNGDSIAACAETKDPGINTLSTSLLRKKVKMAAPAGTAVQEILDTDGSAAPY